MIKFPSVKLKCAKCGGMKYIGEEFHFAGEMWVDVTCINCSHTADIEVNKLNNLLQKLSGNKK
jgi:predicted nucleic-acid-binding Zn-ribbon protein